MSRERRVDEFEDFFHRAIQKVIAYKNPLKVSHPYIAPEELRKNFYEFRYAVRREQRYWPQYWPDIEKLSFTIDEGSVLISYRPEEEPEE